jgi:hypothetical protein
MSGQRKCVTAVTDDDGIVASIMQEVHRFTGSRVHGFAGSPVHRLRFGFRSGSRFEVGSEVMEPVNL